MAFMFLGRPFSSLNQALILTFAAKGAVNRRDAIAMVSAISNSAAVLKSLSPAGRNWGPWYISTKARFTAWAWPRRRHALGAATGAALFLWAFSNHCSPPTSFLIHPLRALLRIWRTSRKRCTSPRKSARGFYRHRHLENAACHHRSPCRLVRPRRLERRYFAHLQRMGKKCPGGSRQHPKKAPGGALKDMAHPLLIFPH